MKKKISGIPPLPSPQLTLFWADKSQNGPFNPQGFVLQFWNFAWAQKYEDSNEEEKISGTPYPSPSPPNNPILGGQKPKWAISPRRVCGTGMKGRRGLQVTKIIVIQGN